MYFTKAVSYILFCNTINGVLLFCGNLKEDLCGPLVQQN